MNLGMGVQLEKGDAQKVLGQVIAEGGIGTTDEHGTLRFVPLPGAAVEVRDL